jgi:hypothetical protein
MSYVKIQKKCWYLRERLSSNIILWKRKSFFFSACTGPFWSLPEVLPSAILTGRPAENEHFRALISDHLGQGAGAAILRIHEYIPEGRY